MEHNVHIEWALNAKAYYQAYRGLCKLRIEYARFKIIYWSEIPVFNKIRFWANVAQYWEKKLEESYTREKEYLGE